MLGFRMVTGAYGCEMKFHVYRAREGFVLSPECMQAPIAVQSTLRPVCECGTLDLPAESARPLLAAVTRDGFAVVDASDPAYAAMDCRCTGRAGDAPA